MGEKEKMERTGKERRGRGGGEWVRERRRRWGRRRWVFERLLKCF